VIDRDGQRQARVTTSSRWLWLSALALAVSLLPSAALAAGGAAAQPAVTHAEVPEFPEMAAKARLFGTVAVRVAIATTGEVTWSDVEHGMPMGLSDKAEAAARKWTFAPIDGNERREALLSFEFVEREETEAPSHLEASLDDRLTMRLVYWVQVSMVRRLTREDGEIPERRCPVHGDVMAVDVVPIEYGSPSSCDVDGDPACRERIAWHEAYWEARAKLFPESNLSVRGGCNVQEPKAEVYFCQACRDAETAWLEGHPAPQE
jgi:TonB family protein